jgi:tetratricopeptide (TPR) repeat protein/DNA-binding SARP family transcriptional activator
VEFRLLGPVQAWIGGRPVDLGVRKQRFVFAVLALEANRLVPTDRLVDLVWPDGPPATARAAVYTYVSRLRANLARVGAADGEVALRRDGSGYVLVCDPARVDAHRFRELLIEAGECADDESRLALLDEALALWSGPVLAGTAPEQTRLRLGHHLEEARLTAIEDRFDALLRLGRHREAADELAKLVGEHSGRHRFTAQLMVALHHADRSTDALAVYRDARRRIVDESGLDPPPELVRLERAILRNEAVAAPVPGRSPLPTPAQLPADLHSFTGRTDELAELLATNASGVWVIDGMAGVGKTALAVHAAHRLIASFPDGQLFIDLHGHTQGLEPVRPADALDRMLRALGVAGDQIPPDTEDRAALFRSRLADQRVLVLLDNAADQAQVQPLLPASTGCLVLITSRRSLTGIDDIRPVPLDVLPRGDAVDLFVTAAGVDGSASDVTEVVELCGRLPLAIRIAAGRLRARPTWTVAHLAERLRDERHRLAELKVGQRSVAAAFRLSYDQLSDRGRHLFRVLGLHPGVDFDTHAAAALADTTVRDAGHHLEELVDVHLLQQRGPGRYAFHDLIRACAVERAAQDEPDPRSPLGRLLDHYLHTAAAAMDLFAPHERHRRPKVATPSTPTPDLPDLAAAAAWLDTELANLLAVAHHAAANGSPAHTCQLASTLFRFLDTRGHYLAAVDLHRAARDSALGDPAAEGRALVDLGITCYRLTRYTEAIEHYRTAVRLFQDAGEAEWQARALHGLGSADQRCGRYAESADHCQRALALVGPTGNQALQAAILHTLGGTYIHLGRYADALDCGKQALALYPRTGGGQSTQAHALHGLGVIYQRLGRYTEALDHYQRAAALFQAIGDPAQALALSCLGMVHLRLGHHAEALDHCHRAIDLSRTIQDRNAELEATYNLGEVLRAVGRPADGLGHLRAALTLARDLDQPHDAARAHDALAHLHDDLGEPDLAAEHRRHALAIFTELGDPAADQVRASLARGASADRDRDAAE